MALVKLPYLNIYRSGGKAYGYYRRGKLRLRLRGEVGSPEFLAHYQVVHSAVPAPRPAAPGEGTLADLIRRYRASPEWKGLAPATRKDYEKGLTVLEKYSTGLVAEMERHHVRAIRDEAADGPPSRANKALTMLSILLSYSVELGWRKDNPALKMPKLKTEGDGYRAWTAEEVEQFRDWAGDGFWRLAILLALCTGQRGQDQVVMRFTDFDGTAIRVKEQKTRSKPLRWIPAHWELCAVLAQEVAARAELSEEQRLARSHILRRPDGSPWKLNAFQKVAGHAIRDAGLKGVVWHGLRPSCATYLAEGGASDADINAIIGHITGKMTRHYRRNADQRRLAEAGIAKLKVPGRRKR